MRRIILVMICLLSLQCDRKSIDEADWLIKSGAYEAKLVETKDLVKKWVKFYKTYRDILESDVIHSSSRRANGRRLDWIFHANPDLDVKGFTMIFNPTDYDIEKEITLNTYYTGIKGKVEVLVNDTNKQIIMPDRSHDIKISVKLSANSFMSISLKSS